MVANISRQLSNRRYTDRANFKQSILIIKNGDNNEKKSCADQRLLRFIYTKIKYPTIARENGIEGMAVVSFVVTEHGTIVDFKILRDPGGACGPEALRVVKCMNELPSRWNPGQQRGKNVRVKYNLPVRFKLN